MQVCCDCQGGAGELLRDTSESSARTVDRQLKFFQVSRLGNLAVAAASVRAEGLEKGGASCCLPAACKHQTGSLRPVLCSEPRGPNWGCPVWPSKPHTQKPETCKHMCKAGGQGFTSVDIPLALLSLLDLLQCYTEGLRLPLWGADLVCHPPRVRGIASSCYLSMASRTRNCPTPLQVLSVLQLSLPCNASSGIHLV